VVVLPEFRSTIDWLRLVGCIEAFLLLRLYGVDLTANLYLILRYRFTGKSIPLLQGLLGLLTKRNGYLEALELGNERLLRRLARRPHDALLAILEVAAKELDLVA